MRTLPRRSIAALLLGLIAACASTDEFHTPQAPGAAPTPGNEPSMGAQRAPVGDMLKFNPARPVVLASVNFPPGSTALTFSEGSNLFIGSAQLRGVKAGDFYQLRLYQASSASPIKPSDGCALFYSYPEQTFAANGNGGKAITVELTTPNPMPSRRDSGHTHYRLAVEFLHMRTIDGTKTLLAQGLSLVDLHNTDTSLVVGNDLIELTYP